MPIDIEAPGSPSAGYLKDAINALELQGATVMIPNATPNVALTNAVATAKAKGHNTVLVPAGDHLLNACVITDEITLIGMSPRSRFVVQNDATNAAAGLTIDYTADVTGEISPTAMADGVNFNVTFSASRDATGTITLPVGQGANWAAGDGGVVYSKTKQFAYDLGGTKEYLGEPFTVAQVVGDVIYLKNRLNLFVMFNAEVKSTLFVRRLSRKRFSMTNIGFKTETDPKLFISGGKRSPNMTLLGTVDADINSITMDGSYQTGIKVWCSNRTKIKDLKQKNFINIPANGGYGYGIDFYGMCHMCFVENHTFDGGRHMFTTNALDSTTGATLTATKWFWVGYPTSITINNFVSMRDDGNAIDFHQAGYGFHINAGSIMSSQESAYAYAADGVTPATSIRGKAIQLRAFGTTVSGVNSFGGNNSISLEYLSYEREAALVAQPSSINQVKDSKFYLHPATAITSNNQPHIVMPTSGIVTNRIKLVIEGCDFIGGHQIVRQVNNTQLCDVLFRDCYFVGVTATDYMFMLWAGDWMFDNCTFDMRFQAASCVPIGVQGVANVTLLNNTVLHGSVVPTNNFMLNRIANTPVVKYAGNYAPALTVNSAGSVGTSTAVAALT